MDNVYLIFGGTGSLGTTLVDRLLSESKEVWVFSRDEAKHHKLKIKFPKVNIIMGDIRDYQSVFNAIRRVKPDIVINAAAIKQVPAAEDFIWEAVQTNINGAFNLANALESFTEKRIKALSISTDKVAKPVNSYGMTKALQERIHLRAQDNTIHIHNCVRYGNVLESTGSVIPVFKSQAYNYDNLKVTHPEMTRFLLSLDEAVDLIFEALEDDTGRKIFIPKIKSAKIKDLAEIIIEEVQLANDQDHVSQDMKIEYTGIRPGEKIHEILISEEEISRTADWRKYYIIFDIKTKADFEYLKEEYSSGSNLSLMSKLELKEFLKGR